MSEPVTPTPGERTSVDSLNVDIVLADDRGETTVLPADPEILARFLAECRELKNGSSPKNKDLGRPAS